MSLITLIVAGAVLAFFVLLCFLLPTPITWLITAAFAALFFMVLLPKYEGEQTAKKQGETVQAAVSDIRHWQMRYGDGNYQDKYEIIALWPNPRTGKMVQFISPPLLKDPKPHLLPAISVTVDTNNPRNYVMDLSFLPEKSQ
ncbi:hypothetical protein [Stenoxybacter acetivorans]|uniref:hypothetical protein n=1 Tax=Stenoxybacter acetivorans TaxID=422441 RepID=UPI0006910CA6|nr:hypothetical protein [Stenoxybacter acetivorans]